MPTKQKEVKKCVLFCFSVRKGSETDPVLIQFVSRDFFYETGTPYTANSLVFMWHENINAFDTELLAIFKKYL
jgi:hypothetical protein